ncbi:MAG: aminoglycoside 6-adenylyltransferase [Devosia sp.]
MNQQALIDAITAAMTGNLALRALFLGGSLGRGTDDQWSDIDFVAVAAADDHSAIAASWRATLQTITPIVFWNQIDGAGIVLNAITADWLRCDLSIQDSENFGARRARNLVKPLIDCDGLYDDLSTTLPDRQPDPRAVRYLINEFIRVLGLLPVAMGRQEYVTSVWGVGLLRNMLIDLLQQHVTLPDPGGVLHLSKLLPAEQMQMLAALPYPGPDRTALIAAHGALAREFFPRARELAARLGLDWPADFEAATRRNLDAKLGPNTIVW